MGAAKGMDLRGIGLATAGGAAVLLVAAQLLVKPAVTPRVATAGRGGGASGIRAPERGMPGNAAATGSTVTLVNTVPRPGAPAPGVALAAEPLVRELFRPLVVQQQQGAPTHSAPAGKAPTLPDVKQVPAAKPVAPTAAVTPTPTPDAPAAEEIKMLGVVELGGQPKALLKRTSTGESRYVAKGEEAFGAQVQAITDSSVDVLRGGLTQRLELSKDIAIEGPGGSSTAALVTPGGVGGRRSFGGSVGGSGGTGRRGGAPGGGGSGGDSGFSTAQLFALPTWTERLKKLEEIKAQLEPERYERLKTFMTERAKSEKK